MEAVKKKTILNFLINELWFSFIFFRNLPCNILLEYDSFFFLLQFIVIFFIVHETWMLCNFKGPVSFVIEKFGEQFSLELLVYWHLFCHKVISMSLYDCLESSNFQLQFEKKPLFWKFSLWLVAIDLIVVLF